jgi:Dyp-type peroxidase family
MLTDNSENMAMPPPTRSAGGGTEYRFSERYRDLLLDLQGNILEPHARHYAVHMFLSFSAAHGKSSDIRRWIHRRVSQRITTAWHEYSFGRHGPFYSFLLSNEGYRWLKKEMPEDPSFKMGMKERGRVLGDPPTDQWDRGYQGEIHALLILADHDPVALAHNAVREKMTAWSSGISVAVEEPGYRLKRNGQDIEHFGFLDGISQPAWFSRLEGTIPQGEPDLDLNGILVEEPSSLGHFGSFLVFRKLEQNILVWEENITRLAERLDVDHELAAAFAVGRFIDGTPVSLYKEIQGTPFPQNDFQYRMDFDGNRCPLHAHIRKTNPRAESDKEYRPITRRGMSYGVRPDLHPEGRKFPLPEVGVGLLFMCFQNSIARQFEHIQELANNPNLPVPGSGSDPLIFQGENPSVDNQWPLRHGSSKRVAFAFDRAVTLKGGEYFFTPSVTFLSNI